MRRIIVNEEVLDFWGRMLYFWGMRVLLDIDGVMVTTPSWKQVEVLEDHFSAFNKRAAACLQKIISETNASLVLTTSHKSRFNISQWKSIFKKRGIEIKHLECLDKNSSNFNRKDEILNWLKNEPEQAGQFVILDDDTSLHDLPSSIKERCVITSSLIGLNEAAAEQAIGILKSKRF
jgi:HAD domain in Swiss Army Knife RNA repair proteins